MPVDPVRAKSLFLAASELPDLAKRTAYLDLECGGDAELRKRVEALLRANDAAPLPPVVAETIDSGLGQSPTVDHRDPTAQVGVVIAGRYKLRQQIGEGGMGTVWMADQTEPVKRKVAVKLIRVEHGQSRTVLARFEAERQAIALMDHPHIAKLLDAGTTDDGSPFFVMELVKGIPLNEFCDQHRLTVQQRLTLFLQICSSVQHAHQKGIIHRDLKPSNVLVESHDGKPVPKVIDFGLAKATTGLQLTDQSLFTAFGSVMGTPLYMAPEQANFNAVDVDTRADVYALGIILYELLTGTTPITRETLKKAALDEMLRLVREQEAPTPSSRLSSVESAPGVAASRQIEPAKLGRFVKGELDWIVLKALSKDRDRRYETANGFARDIERFLNHEPVQAGPPSARYRLQKFVQRNRGQVIAASLVLLALVAGIAGTTIGVIRANHAAAAERAARMDAETERAQAMEQKARAQANEKLASGRLESLQRVNALNTAINHATRAKRLLDNGQADDALILFRKAVETNPGCEFGRDPECLLSDAELKLFQIQLGAEHPETLRIMTGLAAVHLAAGKRDLAVPLYEQALKLRKSALGREHPETIQSMQNLAVAYRAAGNFNQALILGEDTLQLRRTQLGSDHPDTLSSMHELAVTDRAAGKLDAGIQLFEETLALRKAQLGPNHHDTALTTVHLGWAYEAAGQIHKSLPLYEESLQHTRANYNPDHPFHLNAMNSLFTAYLKEGARDKAARLLPELLASTRKRLPPDSPQLARQLASFANVLLRVGAFTEAEPLLRECLTIREQKEPDAWTTFNTQSLLGGALMGQKKYAEAEPLLLKGYEGMKTRKKTIPPQGVVRLSDALDRLIELSTATNKPDEVQKWQAERAKYPPVVPAATEKKE